MSRLAALPEVFEPERIWAAKVTDNYGEWQTSKDGLLRPVEYVRADLPPGYVILSPDEVRALERALSKAEDGAGTLPAREAVKLRPSDWHALAAAIRSLKGGRDVA